MTDDTRRHDSCSACQTVRPLAVTMTLDGRPIAGLCAHCARADDRLARFVATARQVARGVDPDEARAGVLLHRAEGLRDGISAVRFVRAVPPAFRRPTNGTPHGRSVKAVEEPAPDRTTAPPPPPRWQRLRALLPRSPAPASRQATPPPSPNAGRGRGLGGG